MFPARIALVAVVAALLPATSLKASLTIVNTTPGTFIDISPVNQGGDGTGMALGLSSLNPVVSEMVLGINNPLGLSPGSTLVINNRGGIAIGVPPSTSVPSPNQAISTHTAFGGGKALLPFQDDIDTVGDVYYSERQNTSDDRIIIQWQRKGFVGSPNTQTTTFQVQIPDVPPFRGPGETLAQFLYADVNGSRADHGSSATIGYQDDGVTFNDFQWSFDTPSVSNGTVLTVTTIPEPMSLLLLAVGGLTLVRRRG